MNYCEWAFDCVNDLRVEPFWILPIFYSQFWDKQVHSSENDHTCSIESERKQSDSNRKSHRPSLV